MTLKRNLAAVVAAALLLTCSGCTFAIPSDNEITTTTAKEAPAVVELSVSTPEDILAKLTLEQKAAQMVQGANYELYPDDMKDNCYGSVLSIYSGQDTTQSGWRELIDAYQKAALSSDAGVPFIYGNDDVHGINYASGSVIFPHNVNIGAANDEDLTYQMGRAVADEAKLTKMLWNFAPCVAQAADPRWGRTYESYSSDLGIITTLSTAYTRGLVESGVIACAKHFFADGNALYGTGEGDRLIDRGDAQLSDEEISTLLDVYKAQIEAGAQSIMISHTWLNGVKMHENAHYINDVLKGEMGFKGVVVSDWESIHNISVAGLKSEVITAVNAGIDMLMEPTYFDSCAKAIVEAVGEGAITQERVDDAVLRILKMKEAAGLLDDPMLDTMETKQENLGSDEYRALAARLVEESMVLLKNENATLPLKSGTKVYLVGEPAFSSGLQCGGWTITWEGSAERSFVKGATTVEQGLARVAEECGLELITDDSRANEADVTLLCLSETTYAEWTGDTADLSITGDHGLPTNTVAMEKADAAGKPVVTLLFAGRNVIYDDYESKWASIVMCYLPGSEAGTGIANVLTGKSEFTGKLAMPYYSSVEQIGTDECKFPVGYGLTY